jgi:glycerophosphoryl diester phosphodiesterase
MSWLSADRPLIIGHRGAAADAPENTLAAFTLALAQGADGVELDVQLCADGVPIIIHDTTVDRTCDGTGRVADLSLAELRLLTIDNDHPIPTLDDLFATFGRRTLYNVELKALGRGGDALAAAVARAIAAHGVAEQVLISSFSPFTLRAARRHLPPGVPLALLRERRATRAAHALLRAAADHPHHPLIDESLMAWARWRGLRVNAWTVDDPAEARRLLQLGVHGIITNRPGEIRVETTDFTDYQK